MTCYLNDDMLSKSKQMLKCLSNDFEIQDILDIFNKS